MVAGHLGGCEPLPAGATLERQVDTDASLLRLPRYEPFMAPALALARCGADFQEIAGNRGVVLVSLTGPANAQPPRGGQLLLRQPFLTQPGRERLITVLPVASLAADLRELREDSLGVEHLFDY